MDIGEWPRACDPISDKLTGRVAVEGMDWCGPPMWWGTGTAQSKGDINEGRAIDWSVPR